MTSSIGQVVEAGLCLGCGLCVSGTDAHMKLSSDGFLRPSGNTDFLATKIEEVCPGIRIAHEKTSEISYDLTWGPILQLSIGHATDPDVRFAGSSGGVLSAIAIELLRRKEVDGVLQTVADFNDPIGNSTQMSKTRDEVMRCSGSRYAPSSPLAEVEQHLESGQRFAFIGKPCDVAALRRKANVDARINRQIPYMLTFFCAGVPSRKGTEAVLERLAVQLSELKTFRYRGEGWPGPTRAVRHDGSSVSMDYNNSWGEILHKHLQFRCKICPDGTGEFADVACADAWFGKDGYPDFSDRDGRSLIISRTKNGKQILDQLVEQQVLTVEPVDVGEISLMQPYQANRKRSIMARLGGMRLALRLTPRYSNLGLARLAMRQSPAKNFRNLCGTFLRSMRGRL